MSIDCFMCFIVAGLLNTSTCSSSPQICGSFSARAGIQGHIKMHHAHTNVIGLGDSSVWKVPFLPRIIYLFVAPLAVPIITPLVALGKRMSQRWAVFASRLNVKLSIKLRHFLNLAIDSLSYLSVPLQCDFTLMLTLMVLQLSSEDNLWPTSSGPSWW